MPKRQRQLKDCKTKPNRRKTSRKTPSTKTKNSKLLELPMEIQTIIFNETVNALGYKNALRVRLVNKQFADGIFEAICEPRNFNFAKLDVGSLKTPISEPFVVRARMVRLNRWRSSRGDGTDRRFFASMTRTEEFLLRQHPKANEELRMKYRHALCSLALGNPASDTSQDYNWAFPICHYGNDPSVRTHAISVAAWLGDIDLAKRLLRRLHIDRDNYLSSLTLQAARNGHLEILHLFEDYKYDASATGLINILIITARFGHEDMMRYLINESGCAHFYVRWSREHQFGGPVPSLELRSRDIEYNASISQQRELLMAAIQGGNINILQMAWEVTDIFGQWGSAGKNWILYAAVNFNRERVVRWVLREGIDINDYPPIDGRVGSTLPILEVAAQRSQGCTRIVKLLLEKGADRENPAFCASAREGYVDVAKMLLDTLELRVDRNAMLNGSPPFADECETKTPGDQTPLCYAAINGHTSMVSFLIQQGIEHPFPIERVAKSGQLDTLRMLLEADTGYRNYSWHFMRAIKNDDMKVAALFQEFGASFRDTRSCVKKLKNSKSKYI